MGEQQNQQKKQNQEPDLNQLLKVRREKLAELQAAIGSQNLDAVKAPVSNYKV